MKRVWGCAALIFAAIVLVGFWLAFLADARTTKVILDPRGQITRGEVFGVSVGDSAENAVIGLRRGGFTRLTVSKRPPHFIDAAVGEEFIYGYTFDWRQGVACLMIKDGKVQAVAWDFNIFNP